MTAVTDRYAVIGNPIAHSKSPEIHACFAAQTGHCVTYERLLAPLEGFAQSVQDFMRQGGKGANVTIPFKLEAYALATSMSERAQAAGAVNTLRFDDGVIFGDNTDGIGMVTDIVHNAGISMVGKKILLLGAGGAARGVVLPILDQRPAQLVVANRTMAKAVTLAEHFVGRGAISASDFGTLRTPFDIVINATSASLADDVPPVSPSLFSAMTFAYDMMYGKKPTAFMQFAAQHGAAVRDGLGMLVEQAAEAFFVWRGVRPETATVFADLRAKL